jgi:hypothetical protein
VAPALLARGIVPHAKYARGPRSDAKRYRVHEIVTTAALRASARPAPQQGLTTISSA